MSGTLTDQPAEPTSESAPWVSLERADHLEMLLALEQERAAKLQAELLEARLSKARLQEDAAVANRARTFARVWKKYNLAPADRVDPEGNIKRSFP